jgi:hypothetical protein
LFHCFQTMGLNDGDDEFHGEQGAGEKVQGQGSGFRKWREWFFLLFAHLS